MMADLDAEIGAYCMDIYRQQVLDARAKIEKLRSGLDVAIGLAERTVVWTSMPDRERLLNVLRDVRTELREMIGAGAPSETLADFERDTHGDWHER